MVRSDFGLRDPRTLGPSDRTVAPRTGPSHRRPFAPSDRSGLMSDDWNFLMLPCETTTHQTGTGALDVDVIDRRDVERQ